MHSSWRTGTSADTAEHNLVSTRLTFWRNHGDAHFSLSEGGVEAVLGATQTFFLSSVRQAAEEGSSLPTLREILQEVEYGHGDMR